MEAESWSPNKAFKKAFNFTLFASKEMSKASSDPLTKFIGTALVWVFYFPAVMIIFPVVSFLWFSFKKISGQNK